MRRRLEAFIGTLQQATTLEDLQRNVTALRDDFGVAHLIYHSVNSTGRQYAALTYEQSWVERYISEDYARLDPVVLGCVGRFHPVDWKHLDWSARPARAFLGEALGAGVGNQGFSIPIRGPNGQFALFTVNDRSSDGQWQKFTTAHISDVVLAAHFINQRALEIERGTDFTPAPGLSPREIDVLTLLSLGYSRPQAAESLSISEHTFRVYIETAREKLGASNTTHAVARAIARGLLLP